jgi:phosphoglycolate phosphatase
MRFRTYLFDLDGTIVDHFKAIHRSYVFTMNELGLAKPTLQQVRAAIGGGLEHAFTKLIPAEMHKPGLIIYRKYWDETMLDDVELLPGAMTMIERLHAKGTTLGVCTNKHGHSARLICKHLLIEPYMNAVVGAGDTPWLKPAPQMVAHTLSLMGCTQNNSVLIGDSPFDIQAARNGGIACLCVTTGTHSKHELEAEGAEHVFNSLDEMMGKLDL